VKAVVNPLEVDPTYRGNRGWKTYPEDAFKADQHHAAYHVESFLSVPCIHLILERRRGGWRRLLSHVMASFSWQRIISKLNVTTCIKQFGLAKSMTLNHGDRGDVKVSSSVRQFRVSGFKDGILQPGAHGLRIATCKLQALCQGPLANCWHKTCSLAFLGISLTESIWIMRIWASWTSNSTYQWLIVTGRVESGRTQPVVHRLGGCHTDNLMLGQRHSLGTFRILDV